jgi:enterochelin esterase-like enzyme
MQKTFYVFFTMLIIFSVSCHKDGKTEQLSNSMPSVNNQNHYNYATDMRQMTNYMTPAEREKVKIGAVSNKHKYYDSVANIAQYIQEFSIYDEELNKTYIIHVTLPPDYDKNKSYPMYIMTDGIWRLGNHAEFRQMMINGEIEDIITVSIGYDYGIEAERAEVRLVELTQKSDLFLNFITNNLAPYLGELYNIDYKRSALVGHSLGGLFSYYAVFSHYKYLNEPFYYYVIGSPSFFITEGQPYYSSYWRYGDIMKVYFSNNETLEKEIYLAAGNNEEFPDMAVNIDKFLQKAKQYGITTIDYELFNGNHSSYVGEMLHDSLLKFYKK